MNTHLIKTVFRKELIEIWRDKKTLFWIVLSPMFLYPFLMIFVGQFIGIQSNKLSKAKIDVEISKNLLNTPIYDSLTLDSQFVVKTTLKVKPEPDSVKRSVLIYSESNFDSAIYHSNSTDIHLYYDETDDYSKYAKNKIEKTLTNLNKHLLAERLSKFNYEKSFITPISVNVESVAPKEKAFGGMIGNYLPGLILFFIFLGAVYIAMDLTAGEKERRTLQTLYAAPISSYEIVIGKFLPVYTVSLASAFANLIGLGVAIPWQASLAKSDTFSGFNFSLTAIEWSWIVMLLLVITAFIAALSMAVLVLAKTYKEATSYITPLMMVLVIPMILYSLPAMEINANTALIPILNVLLALNAILKGTLVTSSLFIVVSSSICYAMLALYMVNRIFSNESVITGEKVNYKTLITLEKEERKYFGVSEALLFFAIALLLFLYVGMPLQRHLDILIGLPLSFIFLGAFSLAAILFFKLNVKEALQLKIPGKGQVFGTIIMAAGVGLPIAYISSFFIDAEVSNQFKEMIQPLIDSNILIGLSIIALCPAIFEEIIFRGIVFHGLKQQLNKWSVIIISALTFAVMHISFERLFPTFTAGLLLGFIQWRGRSIYLCMLFHFLHNGLFFILVRQDSFKEFYEANMVTLSLVGTALFLLGLMIFNKSSKLKGKNEEG